MAERSSTISLAVFLNQPLNNLVLINSLNWFGKDPQARRSALVLKARQSTLGIVQLETLQKQPMHSKRMFSQLVKLHFALMIK